MKKVRVEEGQPWEGHVDGGELEGKSQGLG